ncbi:MAG: GDP-L-fucose synthase [Armatimonadetes bacterium]|nr:GDP-L-fucose synthase [Armatimonadota bacterium]
MQHNSKIYVAGHTGLLGSAVTRVLRDQGYSNLILRTRQELDLTDAHAVARFMAEERPEYIVLAAARVGGIQANINDPVGFLAENQAININVIHSALEAGVRDLLYIGSSCMYPRDYTNPLKEEYLLAAPLEPTNEGYALAKIAGARLCEYCNRQYSTSYKVLIPCNLYGPNDRFDPASAHLIAAIVQKIHAAMSNGEDSVLIWGDGSARREFLFVDDLADYICRCLGRLDELPDYLNVGYGSDHTVLEYYQMAAEVMGYKGSFKFDTSRPVGMMRKLLDSSRAAAYGWKPRIDQREGIRRTYRYYVESDECQVLSDKCQVQSAECQAQARSQAISQSHTLGRRP